MCYEWIDWIELRIRLNEFEMLIWVYNDEKKIEKCSIKKLENSVNKTMYK